MQYEIQRAVRTKYHMLTLRGFLRAPKNVKQLVPLKKKHVNHVFKNSLGYYTHAHEKEAKNTASCHTFLEETEVMDTLRYMYHGLLVFTSLYRSLTLLKEKEKLKYYTDTNLS